MNRLSPSSVSSTESHPLILVVDDEPRIIRFVRINLEMEGFRVIEAADGLDALNQVRQKMPDMVLLDVMMPEMDGFEVCEVLKSDQRLKDIEIIEANPVMDYIYANYVFTN